MDVLSEVLRLLRLTGAVFFTADFSSPWAIESLSGTQLMSGMPILKAAQCVIFHILAEGRCRIKIEGHEPLEIEANDVLIFPHGDVHVMCSDLGLKPTAILDILPQPPYGERPRLVHGGGGEIARFICGYLHCDQKFDPLFLTLPKLITVRIRRGSVALQPVGSDAFAPGELSPYAGRWLESTVRYLVAEAIQDPPSNSALLARLAELLFVETLRLYVLQLPAGQTGWLAGLKDPYVGKALTLMHFEPAKSWTVKELAHAVGVSRSIFAERFRVLIAQSPMHYMTRWRMELAKQLLCQGSLGVSQIAKHVGYQSEFAFNRAFKLYTGMPPATWRRVRESAPGIHPDPITGTRAAGRF